MTPLEEQIGGNHYKTMVIQPIEISMANGYDACVHSAVKYISRHREKGGLEDINKARHFLRIRHEMMSSGRIGWMTPTPVISPETFAAENGLPLMESTIIFLIHAWAFQSSDTDPNTRLFDMIDDLLEKLATDSYYSPQDEQPPLPQPWLRQ